MLINGLSIDTTENGTRALPHAITKLNKYSMNHLKNVAKESSLFSTAKVRRKLETTSQGARHGVLK